MNSFVTSFSVTDVSNVIHAAKVELVEANGSGVSGTIFLAQDSNNIVTVTGEVAGLSNGPHGFHIHATGAVTNNCADAGGHYNPSGVNLMYRVL